MKRKITVALLAIMMVLAMIPALVIGVSAEEQTDTRIPVPEIPIVTGPMEDTSAFGLDIDAINALFPEETEISYSDGVISVKDIGAGYAVFNNGNIYEEMTLANGYWTLEIGERTESDEVVHFSYKDPDDRSGKSWNISYYNGLKDTSIRLYDYDNNYLNIYVYVSSESLDVQYSSNEYSVMDYYWKGVLSYHKVTVSDSDISVNVAYNPDRSVKYVSVYSYSEVNGGWYYYIPGQGWSSYYDRYIPCEAPEGLEDKDESYFASLAPCLIPCKHPRWIDATCELPKTCEECGETEGEALGHSFADATCELPKTCTVCGETDGEALGHSFVDATTEAPKTCERCGETEGEPLPKPTEPEAPTEPDTPDTPDTPETPEETEETEEPNWFMKIWNAILDFFRRLFGIE